MNGHPFWDIAIVVGAMVAGVYLRLWLKARRLRSIRRNASKLH